MTKYESQIYTVNATQQHAYERMANLKNFEALRQIMEQPEFVERLMANVPAEHAGKVTPEKIEEVRRQFENVVFSEDAVSFDSKLGLITLAITEREEPKLVKLQGVGTPIDVTLWVQLLPLGAYQSKMKVTIGADVNFFIRKMVEKYLKQAPDGIASFLCYLLAM
ncbi:MAG: hypothetical protein MR517_03195 [Bacteroidales bacterium]|nr:hypothetical protein [Bacteroidales bacterium]